MSRWRSAAAFTLVELLIAMAIMLAITGAVFALVNPAGEQFLVQPEAHDLQQRLRAAVGALQHDLGMAGGGAYVGPAAGPLVASFAPILPYRSGEAKADPPLGVFYRADTVSLTYVPSTVAQAQVVGIAPGGAGLVVLARANCGPLIRDRLCGFAAGTPVVIYDMSGRVERGTVVSVEGLAIAVEGPDLMGRVSPEEGAVIAQVVTAVYGPGADPATGAPRLMRYDGRHSNQPVVDHVVSVRFEYFGDPLPPERLHDAPLDGQGPWTTYGPKPPPLLKDRAEDVWPAGENCVFTAGAAAHAPRLAALGAAGELVRLDAAILTDGPWCPDPNDPARFDADLLRVRLVRVVIRAEAGLDVLRGPAGPLFARPGSAPSARAWVPDQEVAFDAAPRNLGLSP
jgi:hypothetical protein